MSEDGKEDILEQEEKVKIPEGSGYEVLVEEVEGNMGTRFATDDLKEFYPIFISYLKVHGEEGFLKRHKELVEKGLDDGNRDVIKMLALSLYEEFKSSKFREELANQVREKGEMHRDPTAPQRSKRVLNPKEWARVVAGDKMVRARRIYDCLGRDERIEAAADYRDWGLALNKTKQLENREDRGKILKFERPVSLPKVAAVRK